MRRPGRGAGVPLLIGIAGGSASGKTTLARAAAAALDGLLIAHDRYYLDTPDPAHHNFDHPSAIETALLAAHLDLLKAGSPAELPSYDFTTHRRRPRSERVEPAPVILVEGILVLAEPALAGRMDLRVFVDAPPDVRLARRILRDGAERARSAPDVVRQYLETVRPMHERFVAPSMRNAHLVVSGTRPPAEALGALLAAVEELHPPAGT